MKKFLFALAALIVVSSSPGIFTVSGNEIPGAVVQKPKPPPEPKAPKKAPKPKEPKKPGEPKPPRPPKKPKSPPKPPWVK